jgi:hypothetical protein
MLKKIIFQILIIGILGIEIVFSQTEVPFYEQIAFDFYRTEILSVHPVEKKLKVYRNLYSFFNKEYPAFFPNCLNHKWAINDSFIDNVSNRNELNLNELNDSRFKLKKYGKGAKPKICIQMLFN